MIESPPFLRDVRAVLFDFDGTLADSYAAITASVNYVRSLYQMPPLSIEEVHKYVGRGAADLLHRTVGQGDPQANADAYKAHHPTVMLQGTHLLPGAEAALRFLKQRGIKLGVCSNKPIEFTRDLLTYLGIRTLLDVVLGPEEVAHPKPAPDMVLEALARLHVAANEARYIGDMTIDIQTGRSAGVAVWVVTTGSDTEETLRAARPDRLMHSLAEIEEGGE